MAKSFCLVFIILWGASSWSKLKTTDCGPRALATQNCHVSWVDLKVHIRGDKVNSNNGVHRSLVDFPVAGPNVEWKSLKLRRLGKELFLEAEVWGEPAEKTEVSELIWIVFKFTDVTPDLVINKKIQSAVSAIANLLRHMK